MYQKRNYGLMPRTLGGLFEDMFSNNLSRINEDSSYFSAPVNIRETEKSFDLQLIAPGIKKEEFKINVEKNIMTISYDHKEENKEEKEGKVLRNEYYFRSFRRSFTLNDTIDAGKIAASYTDGVLTVNMPKKDMQAPASQVISIN